MDNRKSKFIKRNFKQNENTNSEYFNFKNENDFAYVFSSDKCIKRIMCIYQKTSNSQTIGMSYYYMIENCNFILI